MKERFKTSIGGQALIEGVMMRGPKRTAMAVRKPDGSIGVEAWDTKAPGAWYKKIPFVRGIFNLVDTLVTGYKCLMRSMEIAGFEDEEPTKFELWLAQKFGKSGSSIASGAAVILGVALAIGLFMVLPSYLAGLLGGVVPMSNMLRTLLEGVIKICIFFVYLALVSKLNELRRVFEYHGAEHKTIACYERGLDLTVENIRSMPRFHPRCGTSFMLIVLIVSIILFSVVTWSSVIVRVVLKLALLPVVIGIAYEIIKFAGRYDNAFTAIISAPGMLMQRLTAFEPDDSQIEVAIESMIPCIPEEKGSDEW